MTTLRLALVLALVVSLGAQTNSEEQQRTFEEANTAYRMAQTLESDRVAAHERYLRAARRYEWLIQEGALSNSSLYFNLANSLLGAEDYGRAVLNYRRALLLSPGDATIEQNLGIARERRRGGSGRDASTSNWSTVVRYLPPVFLTLWLLFWGALTMRLYKPRLIERGPVLVLGGFTAVVLGLTLFAASDFAPRHGVVTATQSLARQGDGLSFEQALSAPVQSGEEFRILEQRSRWSQVELASGATVWLARSDFAVVEELR
jgi:tetratricopeptide (TPR) repeat protein